MNSLLQFRGTRRRQRGVSLIIAMLMLVVIGLMSVAIIRNATSSDQAVTSNRLQTQANQFAQIALQFCENQLALPPGVSQIVTVVKPAPTPAAWTVKANWINTGTAVWTLRSADINSVVKPKVYPQCLVEQSTFSLQVYTVTARGFSDDYTHDANNATTSGSVVWLQSTVYL